MERRTPPHLLWHGNPGPYSDAECRAERRWRTDFALTQIQALSTFNPIFQRGSPAATSSQMTSSAPLTPCSSILRGSGGGAPRVRRTAGRRAATVLGRTAEIDNEGGRREGDDRAEPRHEITARLDEDGGFVACERSPEAARPEPAPQGVQAPPDVVSRVTAPAERTPRSSAGAAQGHLPRAGHGVDLPDVLVPCIRDYRSGHILPRRRRETLSLRSLRCVTHTVPRWLLPHSDPPLVTTARRRMVTPTCGWLQLDTAACMAILLEIQPLARGTTAFGRRVR